MLLLYVVLLLRRLLLRVSWRVHELPDDGADCSAPEREELSLLAYRDEEGLYRQLELTELARAIVGRLWHGEALGASITAACEVQGEPLTQLVIDGISTVLADLAERGVVLGGCPTAIRRSPSPWAFRLYGGIHADAQ